MSGPLIRVSCSECVCALTCLCSGVWGQRMLFQGHCWCGTKWTSPGGRPVTSGRPLAVSTTAVTSLLGHTEQRLFDTAWLWWIAAIGLCCLFAPERSLSGFSVNLCPKNTCGKCHISDWVKVTLKFFWNWFFLGAEKWFVLDDRTVTTRQPRNKTKKSNKLYSEI